MANPRDWSQPPGPARILIVDDEVSMRRILARVIESFGHEIEQAADGIEALAKLPFEFDLVMLDAEMPNMDGFEVATRIREDPEHSDLPIIMVTGDAELYSAGKFYVLSAKLDVSNGAWKGAEKLYCRVKQEAELARHLADLSARAKKAGIEKLAGELAALAKKYGG